MDGRTNITRLFRNPAQLLVLARVVPRPEAGVTRILVYGVADGAEAVSLLATFLPRDGTDVVVVGRDVDDELLAAAEVGTYLPGHAPGGLPAAGEAVLERRRGGGWTVRPEHRGALRFERGDVHHAGADAAGAFDLVVCQNTFVLFDPPSIPPAVAGLAAHVAPGGILALGGGPLEVVPAAAAAAGLEPVLDDVELVHEGWEVQRAFWSNPVRPPWALEPFDPTHPEAPVRYATLFRRAVGTPLAAPAS